MAIVLSLLAALNFDDGCIFPAPPAVDLALDADSWDFLVIRVLPAIVSFAVFLAVLEPVTLDVAERADLTLALDTTERESSSNRLSTELSRVDMLHSEKEEGERVFFRRKLDSREVDSLQDDVTGFPFVTFPGGRPREEGFESCCVGLLETVVRESVAFSLDELVDDIKLLREDLDTFDVVLTSDSGDDVFLMPNRPVDGVVRADEALDADDALLLFADDVIVVSDDEDERRAEDDVARCDWVLFSVRVSVDRLGSLDASFARSDPDCGPLPLVLSEVVGLTSFLDTLWPGPRSAVSFVGESTFSFSGEDKSFRSSAMAFALGLLSCVAPSPFRSTSFSEGDAAFRGLSDEEGFFCRGCSAGVFLSLPW